MSDLKLVIGDKNRCPFSLRAWLLLKYLDLEFDEVGIRLGRPDTRERILEWSPSGRLPLLVAGEIRVWDSLAIAEFLADHFPSLWPSGAEARALARSVCAEIHGDLRLVETFLPLDFSSRFSPPGRLPGRVAQEVRRVAEIWTACREGFGADGPFLFGDFTIADAMFAPLCAQFLAHGVPLDPLCREYVETIIELPPVAHWAEEARKEAGIERLRTAPPVPRAPLTLLSEHERPAESPSDEALSSRAEAPPSPVEAAPLPPEPLAYFGEDDDEDEGPPAPGLPGVVASRRLGDDEEPAQPGGRRLARGGAGLFRWRQPAAAPGGNGNPPPSAPPVTPFARRAAAPPPQKPIITAPLPRPEPLPGAPLLTPVGPDQPPARAPAPRVGAVKPIGDGIHRRR